MNKAIVTTLLLVLVFLGVNVVYLYKLTVGLQETNDQIQKVEASVDKAGAAITMLRDAVKDELRQPAADLARQAKEKIKDVDLGQLLGQLGVKIQKAQEAGPATAGNGTNRAAP